MCTCVDTLDLDTMIYLYSVYKYVHTWMMKNGHAESVDFSTHCDKPERRLNTNIG